MIEFEAKIKGIAVPVNYEPHITYLKLPLSECKAKLAESGDWDLYRLIINNEIIGLSSEILKSEILAKKVVKILSYGGFGRSGEEWENYNSTKRTWCNNAIDSFQSLLDKYNIVGENLILRRL